MALTGFNGVTYTETRQTMDGLFLIQCDGQSLPGSRTEALAYQAKECQQRWDKSPFNWQFGKMYRKSMENKPLFISESLDSFVCEVPRGQVEFVQTLTKDFRPPCSEIWVVPPMCRKINEVFNVMDCNKLSRVFYANWAVNIHWMLALEELERIVGACREVEVKVANLSATNSALLRTALSSATQQILEENAVYQMLFRAAKIFWSKESDGFVEKKVFDYLEAMFRQMELINRHPSQYHIMQMSQLIDSKNQLDNIIGSIKPENHVDVIGTTDVLEAVRIAASISQCLGILGSYVVHIKSKPIGIYVAGRHRQYETATMDTI